MDAVQPPGEGEGSNPILDALPPKSDYMTYLTILEYQLTTDRLPSLQKVLEDDSENALTENIGWDLVQLLLPMLPQSDACLDLVARKGNPKEVIVRVTEALEKVANDALNETENEEGEDYDAEKEGLRTFEGEAERIHLGEMKLDGMPESTNVSQQTEEEELGDGLELLKLTTAATASLPPLQLSMLLSMLSILHPRIKTKSPSRFLATSLQAVLRAYRGLIMPSTTAKVVELLTKLSGRQRPALPPRSSTAEVNQSTGTASTENFVSAPLPDPEAESDDTNDAAEESDKAIVTKLLQAVALEVLEDFVLDAGSTQESGMGWTTRLREQLEPKKTVPGRKTDTERFRSEKDLRSTDLIVEKLARLCSFLDLNHPSSFSQIFSPNMLASGGGEQIEEEPSSPTEYPTSASEIPFSAKGLLFHLSALSFNSVLSYYKDIPPPSVSAHVFPDLSHLLSHYLEVSATGPGNLAQCPVSVLDAILSLFYLAIHTGKLGSYPSSAEDFRSGTWQPILYLSAQYHVPQIRFFACLISTQLLHKHPSGKVRLALIEDTLREPKSSDGILQQMVVEPLRSVAVGWLKTEVQTCLATEADGSRSVFVDGSAAEELPTLLFPQPPLVTSSINDDDKETVASSSISDQEMDSFISRLGFYTATLNFGYFLRSLGGVRASSAHIIGQLKDAYSTVRCKQLQMAIDEVRKRKVVEDVGEGGEELDLELRVCEYALEQIASKG